MKHSIEAGCDSASVCFFDPEALPADFDAQVEDDSVGLMEQLQQQQMLWFRETGGDGSYTFHLYVNEDVPPSLRSKSVLVDSFEAFAIPSGRLCICGTEYAANNPLLGSQFTPAGGLEKYSGMGSIIELEAGDYCMEVLEIEWSDEDWDAAQASVVPKNQLRRHRYLKALMIFCFLIGGIGLLFGVTFLLTDVYHYFFQSPLNNYAMTQVQDLWQPTMSILTGGILVGAGLLLARHHNRSVVTRLLGAVSQEMPDYALVAHKLTGVQT